MYEVQTLGALGDIVIPGGPFLPGPLVLPSPSPAPSPGVVVPPVVPPLVVPPAAPASSPLPVPMLVAGGVALLALGILGTWLVMRR